MLVSATPFWARTSCVRSTYVGCKRKSTRPTPAGERGRVWSGGVLGGAAHARDRAPHGVRRDARGRRSVPGPSGADAGRRWRARRHRALPRDDPPAPRAALRRGARDLTIMLAVTML